MFGSARYVALLLVGHPDQHGHMAVIRVIATRGRAIMVTPALFLNSKVDWIVRTAFSKGRQRKTILERPALIRRRSHFRSEVACVLNRQGLHPGFPFPWKNFLRRMRIARQQSYFSRAIGGTTRSIQI